MNSDSSTPTSDHVDIGGYLTGELDREQAQRVEEHLAGCAECRAEVESLREWQAALGAVPEAMLLDGPRRVATCCCNAPFGRSAASRPPAGSAVGS